MAKSGSGKATYSEHSDGIAVNSNAQQRHRRAVNGKGTGLRGNGTRRHSIAKIGEGIELQRVAMAMNGTVPQSIGNES